MCRHAKSRAGSSVSFCGGALAGDCRWRVCFARLPASRKMFYLLSLSVNNAQRLDLVSFGQKKDAIFKNIDGNTSRITVVIKDQLRSSVC